MSKELIEITSLLRMRFVTNDTCHKAADRIEELERDLLNLVCRIHRDGGHYIAKYGEAKAIADADTVVAQNNADLDALQADNARLREALEYCVTQVGELATVPGIASALSSPSQGWILAWTGESGRQDDRQRKSAGRVLRAAERAAAHRVA